MKPLEISKVQDSLRECRLPVKISIKAKFLQGIAPRAIIPHFFSPFLYGDHGRLELVVCSFKLCHRPLLGNFYAPQPLRQNLGAKFECKHRRLHPQEPKLTIPIEPKI